MSDGTWDVLQAAAWGPYLAAAGLLVVAGVPKVRDPLPLVRALRSVGLPAPQVVVRAGAVAEVVLGVVALVRPGAGSAALVAAAYLAFSGFVALALARGGVLGSCGCFGRPDTPPTRAHLLVTSVLAVAAALVAAGAVVDPAATSWPIATPLGQVVLAALSVLVAVLAYLALAVLPTVSPAAVRSATTARRG